MRKLKNREELIEWLAWAHSASQLCSWNMNRGSLASEFVLSVRHWHTGTWCKWLNNKMNPSDWVDSTTNQATCPWITTSLDFISHSSKKGNWTKWSLKFLTGLTFHDLWNALKAKSHNCGIAAAMLTLLYRPPFTHHCISFFFLWRIFISSSV